jgi:hypothetical protein
MAMLSMSRSAGGADAHRYVLALAGVLSASVLVITSSTQVFDATFFDLSQATSLLAGDRPYRDFYERGMPLAAYLAAGSQLAGGYRLLGEFVRQWCFIIAGIVLATHVALRLSRSVPATLVMMALALIVLAGTPIYHYSKLFFFPLTIALAWRYIENPGVRRGVALGLTAGVAFLFRHDFGIYLAFGSILAFVLARAAVPASRHPRAMINEIAGYTLAAVVIVAPWAAVVQANEGLLEYTKASAVLYEGAPAPYPSLLKVKPLQMLLPEPAPPSRPGVVAFVWNDTVPDGRRRQLAQELGLRVLQEGGIRGQWRYEAPNVYDVRLLRLASDITETEGIEWDRLRRIRWHLPTRENAAAWLQTIALIVPLLLLASAALHLWRSWRRAERVPVDVWRMLFAGIFLVGVDTALFREPSYAVVVAPVTAALSARFVAGRPTVPWFGAVIVLALTGFAAVVWVRGTPLFHPRELTTSMPAMFAVLLKSPPDYGDPAFRYLRDCTPPGNHLLITGMAAMHVSYYAHRPFAGGQTEWHFGWRSDPDHEALSLALLERQSVPIAFSTHDPVLVDFQRYPRIAEYLMQHYVAVEGTGGKILVDARRQPTGRHGPTGFPCFQ